jgi:hypothetical protein
MKNGFLIGLALAVTISGGRPTEASEPGGHEDRPDVVIEWNGILQKTIPSTAAIMSPRFYAMMHLAMFDAANSVEPAFHKYQTRIRRRHGASAEAAAAQAAHDVLLALIPTGQSTFDAALAARLATIPPGQRANGVALGREVASAILASRANDGWGAAEPGYSLPPFPGLWQVTPGSTVATFTRIFGVRPFALLTGTQYLPPPPPTLTSDRYTEDFNEVKAIGSIMSATRTADQTLVSRLWAGVATVTRTNLFAVWSNVARDAARARGLSLVQTARLYALLWISVHDGLLTTQTSKFVYGLWRPVTAIQRADEDLNPLTSPDPGWLPLITTPSYPAYAGNMACVGASAATVLARVLDTNDMPVTIVWRSPDDLSNAAVRNYAGFWQAAQEQERSRVWGGIHYSFDGEASQVVCPKVAAFAVANYMTPRH